MPISAVPLAPTSQRSELPTCENCGHTRLEPFHVPGRAQLWHCSKCELYQKGTLENSNVYEDSYHEGYLRKLPRKTMTAHIRIARVLPLLDEPTQRSAKLLDIGCSIGATVTAARNIGWDAHGVDVSETAVSSCRERGLNCKLFSGQTLPYDDETFDLVTSWHVIEHVSDVSQTLEDWYRVLRPGGLLVLETPNSRCWKARLLGKRYKKFWPAEHLYTFTPSNLIPFVRRAGFESLAVPHIVWPSQMQLKKLAYSIAHQSFLALTKATGFCKAFQVVARRPRNARPNGTIAPPSHALTRKDTASRPSAGGFLYS